MPTPGSVAEFALRLGRLNRATRATPERDLARIVDTLVYNARALHYLAEVQCGEGGLTPRQEGRQRTMEVESTEIVENLGLRCWHQRDPRGPALFLVPLKTTDDEAFQLQGTSGALVVPW